MPKSKIPSLNPTVGMVYHGKWPSGRIERNRKIYDFELVFFSQGTGRVLSNAATYYCQPGSLIIIPPGTEHCSMGDTPCERWCIHFDWFGDCKAHQQQKNIWIYSDETEDFNPELAASYPPKDLNLTFPLHKQLEQEDTQKILDRLTTFFYQTPQADFSQALRKQATFLEILAFAVDQSHPSTMRQRVHSNFFNAKNLMDHQYQEIHVNIAQIARQLNLTPNHINKLFRSNVGTTATDYLQNLRLNHAKNLLSETTTPIKEIAFAAGFNNPNYFSRLFHRQFGLTPRTYRESYGEKQAPQKDQAQGKGTDD